jgi:hypothetical protein
MIQCTARACIAFLVLPGLPAACWTKYQNEKIALISIILVFREIEMHIYSYTRSSKDSGKVTVLLCVNSYGSDKQVPIVIGKSPKPWCFKNIKKLPSKHHVNNKAWMNTDIFSSFLRSLDASTGAQNRNILLFVDNSAAHQKYTSFLRNVKVIRYPANCTSVPQPLDLGVIKCYKQLYRKRLVQTAVCLMDAGKDMKRR